MAKQTPNRSKAETLSLRISPDLKFGLELLAKLEERSLTTEVEKALKELFVATQIDASHFNVISGGRIPEIYFIDVLEMIYSPDAPTRVIRTAIAFPHLLTQKEKVIMQLIAQDPESTFIGSESEFFFLDKDFKALQEELDERFRRHHEGYDLSLIRKNWMKLNEAADFTMENGHFPHEYNWLA